MYPYSLHEFPLSFISHVGQGAVLEGLIGQHWVEHTNDLVERKREGEGGVLMGEGEGEEEGEGEMMVCEKEGQKGGRSE